MSQGRDMPASPIVSTGSDRAVPRRDGAPAERDRCPIALSPTGLSILRFLTCWQRRDRRDIVRAVIVDSGTVPGHAYATHVARRVDVALRHLLTAGYLEHSAVDGYRLTASGYSALCRSTLRSGRATRRRGDRSNGARVRKPRPPRRWSPAGDQIGARCRRMAPVR